MLSLLALKRLDKERRSHIDDFNCDQAGGLFAGLNILPKKTFATDYSYRTERAHQGGLPTAPNAPTRGASCRDGSRPWPR